MMCTYSGKRFNPIDPNIDDISIMDIAQGLSNVCRYGGQCKKFYSVAQHSVIVSWNVSYKNAKWGLLHDASEAYIGDIISPLKVTEQYQTYREIEQNLMDAICTKFGLKCEIPEEVKEYDLIVRATEMRDFGSIPKEFWENEDKLPYGIEPLDPIQSKILFLKEFSRLFGYDENASYYF